jgi:hypothetical protein
MDETDQKRFHYHASAHVLSGEIWRPFQHVIEVQAPSVLPSTGGMGDSRIENFRRDDLISFKAGYTHVMGSKKRVKDENGKDSIVYTTQVTATVEGLNILDVVTADRAVARMTSSHELNAEEASIRLVGSKFENLQIAGCKANVIFDHDLLLRLETFEAVRNEFAKPSDLRKMAEDTHTAIRVAPPPKQLETHGVLLCSLVKEIDFKCPGVERRGRHAFHVKDFGTIFLGEVVFERGRKTLTMFRLELGSPCDAGLTVLEASSNGRKIPP